MARRPLICAALLVFGATSAPAALPAVAVPQPAVPGRHQRVLPLQGGRNFRDLGGYRTLDGRTVRWGLLFRSGSMAGLTAADHRYLAQLGIRTVCDFRSTDERRAEPATWPSAPPRVLATDYDQPAASGPPPADAAEVRMMMVRTYRELPERFNDQYRRMFAELLAGRAPLAFNCSGGKDRTGVAAALLLTALGVPRATVVDDYLLTNRVLDPAKVVNGPANASHFAHMPPDMVQAYMAADRRYLDATFAVVDAYPGGVDAYLRDKLGVDAAARARLRQLYTE